MEKRVRLTQRLLGSKTANEVKKAEKDSIYTMDQDRPFEPERNEKYVKDMGYLDWEKTRDVPEAGPKEPRNEIGLPEPGDATKSAGKVAAFELFRKSSKVIRIAKSLLPNLPIERVESLATALLGAEDDLVDAAYQTVSGQSVSAIADAAPAATSDSASAPSGPSSTETAVSSESPTMAKKGKDAGVGVTISLEDGSGSSSSSEADSAESAPSDLSSVFTTGGAQPEFEIETEAAVSDTPADPDMDLFGQLFAGMTAAEVKAVEKVANKKPVGLTKLPGGPRETTVNRNSVSYLEGLWPKAPDVSGVFD